MIYLFLECAKPNEKENINSSEYTFWDNINKYIYNNKLNIVACGGIENVYEGILSANLKKDDIGIVNIDLMDSDNANIIKDISTYSKNRPNLSMTNQSCFEDLLLHFSYLIYWLYPLKVRETKQVKDRIEALNQYLSGKIPTKLQYVINDYKEKGGIPTKETIAFNTLNYICNYTYGGGFLITKGKLGECWYCNCKDKSTCKNFYKDNRGQYQPTKKFLDKTDCGLSHGNRKNSREKLEMLYGYTYINNYIKKAKDYFYKNKLIEAKNLLVF